MLNRRRFLQSSSVAVAAASLFPAPAVVSGRDLNSKLQLAGIGCEGKGWSDINEMASHPRAAFVAFCDVDLGRVEKVRKLQPDAPVYQDYREMLAKHGDAIDGVTVSTPDHMHAIQTLAALRMGKHVYCQKPLTHTIWEARQVRLQAAQSGVITRLGNQIHSHTFYRTAVQAIQNGVIGKVKRVHSWCQATGHGKSGFIDRPPQPTQPPETLNWDLWLGVAPQRPFGVLHCYHPFGWRDFQAFGNGALGDFGCHILDPVFTALQIEGDPIDVKADHTGMNDEVWPAQTTVNYSFPGTRFTTGDKLQITWYDGGRLPNTNDSHVPREIALPRSGSLFIGETGSLVLPHTGELRLYPQDRYASTTVEKAEDLNHYHGWIDGCLSGKQPSDGFEYGGRLTEAVLLGNIALRYKSQTLKWDAPALKVTNLDEANRWVTKEYRAGWEIAAV